MNRFDSGELGPYLERLHELPFVGSAELGHGERQSPGFDAMLTIRAKHSRDRFKLQVEHKRSRRLNEALVGSVLACREQAQAADCILFTPHVTPAMGARLVAGRMNFMDLSGNCRLALGDDYVAQIEGRRPVRAFEDERVVGRAGYQVIFTLLADATSRILPVRELAARAGVGKSLVGLTLIRLEGAGLIVRVHGGIFVPRPRQLFERWLVGYLELVRPHSVLGRYQSLETDPTKLEERISAQFADAAPATQVADALPPFSDGPEMRFAWGGVSAAWRLIRHYRGGASVVHVTGLPPDFAPRLQLLPSRTGNLTVLSSLGKSGFSIEHPLLAHPILVYAELLATGDPRAAETAELVRSQFLSEWS